jgi:serine/threonine protein kinase
MQGVPTRFDRYELLAPLGAGGMGEVVKARALGPHGFEKVVAIKRIRAEWAEQDAMAERFIREARIAARLQHANIVQVFDFGRHGAELFIVMEYVDGQSLDAILAALRAEGKHPSLAQSLQIALDVARALDCAHTLTDDGGRPEGVVHRDVTPGNVLVSRQGLVKLTDFGIAAIASSHEGRTSLAGKPLYMAPEQFRGDPVDGRADLFGLGMVLYEMLTGRRPWKGMVDPSPDATLASMGYEPPSTRSPAVPPELDALVERLLAPEREARIGSARELTKELVALSYRCQIVLDPSELAPLLRDPVEVAHAPTLPQVHTLVATGVSPDGVTLLRTADDPIAEGGTVAEGARTRGGVPGWVWGALALGVVGVGALAAWTVTQDAAHASLAGSPRLEVGARSTVAVPELRAERVAEEPVVEQPVVEQPVVEEPEVAAIEPAVEPPEPVVPAEPAVATEPEAPSPPANEPERERPARTPRTPRPTADERPGSAPEPAGSGELDVFSRPWAEIWIDGVRQPQNAPARGLRVAAGTRRVRLVNPVVGLSAERTVQVPANGRAQLRVFLDPTAADTD